MMDWAGLQHMPPETVFGLVANWWWMILPALGIVILRRRTRKTPLKYGHLRRGDRRRSQAATRKSSTRGPPRRDQEIMASSRTITGKAYVTDGDGIRVAGQEIRISGIDAPEWNQMAKHRNGYWFNHGRYVKSVLIQKIGGRQVRVSVEGRDRFGRLLGTVTYNGKDIAEWLVREGHAIAAYSDRYSQVEKAARDAKRGMWGHSHNFDPRTHRHRAQENP